MATRRKKSIIDINNQLARIQDADGGGGARYRRARDIADRYRGRIKNSLQYRTDERMANDPNNPNWVESDMQRGNRKYSRDVYAGIPSRLGRRSISNFISNRGKRVNTAQGRTSG